MKGLPHGFEVLEMIQDRVNNNKMDLKKALLIAIWKSVPDSERSLYSVEHEYEMQRIFDAFNKACDGCSNRTLKETFEKTEKTNGYPWQWPLNTSAGNVWAEKMALAALELPKFVDKDVDDMTVRFQKVKDVFEEEVHAGRTLLNAHNNAFNVARAEALLKRPTITKKE
jgi:hypothetical protein